MNVNEILNNYDVLTTDVIKQLVKLKGTYYNQWVHADADARKADKLLKPIKAQCYAQAEGTNSDRLQEAEGSSRYMKALENAIDTKTTANIAQGKVDGINETINLIKIYEKRAV